MQKGEKRWMNEKKKEYERRLRRKEENGEMSEGERE
jgi:hypothetical protein